MPAPGYSIGLVADPDQAETVYVTTDRGIYVSRDGGETWTPFWIPNPRLGSSSGVCALAFDPRNRSTLFSVAATVSRSRRSPSMPAASSSPHFPARC